jgi:hypothetical protein
MCRTILYRITLKKKEALKFPLFNGKNGKLFGRKIFKERLFWNNLSEKTQQGSSLNQKFDLDFVQNKSVDWKRAESLVCPPVKPKFQFKDTFGQMTFGDFKLKQTLKYVRETTKSSPAPFFSSKLGSCSLK